METEPSARLQARDGRWFEMSIVGYQFPAANGGPSPSSDVGTGRKDNWLRIGIDVKDTTVAWRSIDAALSFNEAVELSVLTQNLGRGGLRTIDFEGLEPCFAMRAAALDDGSIDAHLIFDVEMHPQSRHYAGDPHIMRIPLTGVQLMAFGDALAEQLRRLPR